MSVTLKGSFYEEELQKVTKVNQLYHIEAILDKRENKRIELKSWSSGQDTQPHLTVGSTDSDLRKYKG